jgi:hypothetical protein
VVLETPPVPEVVPAPLPEVVRPPELVPAPEPVDELVFEAVVVAPDVVSGDCAVLQATMQAKGRIGSHHRCLVIASKLRGGESLGHPCERRVDEVKSGGDRELDLVGPLLMLPAPQGRGSPS